MLLLNPGPVTLTERVRNSLLQTDLVPPRKRIFRSAGRGAHAPASICTVSTPMNGKRC